MQVEYSLSDICEDIKDDVNKVKFCTAFLSMEGAEQLVEDFGMDVKYEIVFDESIAGYSPKGILPQDAEVFQYNKNKNMHSKFAIIYTSRDNMCVIGSSNLTGYGYESNIECNILLEDDTWRTLQNKFTKYKKDSIKPDFSKITPTYKSEEHPVCNVDGRTLLVNTDSATDEQLSLLRRYCEEKPVAGEFKKFIATPNVVYRDNLDSGRLDELERITNQSFRDTVESLSNEIITAKSTRKPGVRLKYHGDKLERFKSLINDMKAFCDGKLESKGRRGRKVWINSKYYYQHREDAFVQDFIHNYDDYSDEDYGFYLRRSEDYDCGRRIDCDWSGNVQLWEYQKDWFSVFMNGGRNRTDPANFYEVDGPSGSGKTYLGVRAICGVDLNTLIISPTIRVCDQWKKTITKLTNIKESDICEFYDGNRLDKSRDVVVTTYASAEDCVDELDDSFGLVIYDESHRLRGDEYGKLAKNDYLKSDRKLALSATSLHYLEATSDTDVNFTYNFTRIDKTWDDVLETAASRDYIQIPDIYCLEKQGKVRQNQSHKRGLDKKSASDGWDVDEKRFGYKMRRLKQISKRVDEKIIVFVNYRRHGEKIIDNASEFDADFVHGGKSIKKRKEAYESFENGNIDILVLTRVGNEGINIKDVNIAVMFSWSGDNPVEGTQRIGRIMRYSQNGAKPKAIFIVNNESERETAKGQLEQFENREPLKNRVDEMDLEASSIQDVF